ncbi:MAG: hypothetical protein OP8BY_1276 [Candidatus Saccharicenans subterraneus]|uniref:Uncharacterized protein n=1 Tax=Candidatus Saccharicenans subterraneus TaxID=2508984 RepID=A0A3E2BPH0_9BACT|nr:MAG: hypothetical protein OP8BY_1276 [Candidatus Saccharicenans subterraneum]
MNFKKFFALSLVLILTLTLAFNLAQAEPQKKDQKKDQKAKTTLPTDVKALLEQGLATRQVKPDLPFNFHGHYILPARGTYIAIFITRIKNADLEYVQTQSISAGDSYQTESDIFFQIYQNDGPTPKLMTENKAYSQFSIPAGEYNPEGESCYYLGYPLPAGKYILAAALGNRKTKKIGTTYYEFEIPRYEDSYKNGQMETTSLLLLKNYEQLDTAENYPNFHKDYFGWMILKAYPYTEMRFKPNDQPTLMFMIYGSKFDESQKAALEINFDIRKGDTKIVAFTPMTYESPFIEQPIPIPAAKQVKVTDDKGERVESRPLEGGGYELVISIKDKIGGTTLEKRVPFELVVE